MTAAGAQGSPATVPVTLTVSAQPPPPALAVSPASLAFAATAGGSAPAGKTIDVTNTGGGTLSFSVVRRRGVAVGRAGERLGAAGA